MEEGNESEGGLGGLAFRVDGAGRLRILLN